MAHPGVHLIGSVAMPDAESVFRAVAGELGPWLKRIPDGETGKRHRWIFWQQQMLLDHPAMRIDKDAETLKLYQWDGQLIRESERIGFKPGVDPKTVEYETGYAPAAIESYGVFKRLRDAGAIPGGVRFQVALPTPMASGYMYVSPAALADYLPAYERSLLKALEQICAAIPHQDLSIQWDVCQEVLVFENYFKHRPADYKGRCTPSSRGCATPCPPIEVGVHLCYGSPRTHLVMPKDMAILVEMSTAHPRLTRRLDFHHLPVPKDRSDDAYFAPLKDLKLPRTTLYLGLIHFDDHRGDMLRAAAAQGRSALRAVERMRLGSHRSGRVSGLIAAHRRAMEVLGS